VACEGGCPAGLEPIGRIKHLDRLRVSREKKGKKTSKDLFIKKEERCAVINDNLAVVTREKE
jgi:hypothetical protein